MSDYELDPVDSITVGAVGPPGRRTFYLQARSGPEAISLLVEKQHVVSLGRGAEELLARVGYPEPPPPEDPSAMALDERLEPAFRVGTLSFGFVEERDMVVLECLELEEVGGEASHARFWLTRGQLQAMGRHGLKVAAEGRPICQLCGVPMDPDGHVCFAMNGHRGEG